MNFAEAQRVIEQFQIKGQCSIIRDQIKIDTGNNLKCIKKANYNIERLMFIYELKEYVAKKGFSFIDRFDIAPDDKPYIMYNNEIYVLTDWIEGRECNFDNISDAKAAVETLALLHKCLLGYVPSSGIKVRSELGNLPALLKKRSEEFLKIKKIAKKGKNRFDYLYMENVDFFLEKSLNSLEIINSDIYRVLVDKAEKEMEFCHRDYSYHNLIINRVGNFYVLNFDFCCQEIRTHDIVSLLRKIMSECNWNVEVAINVINWYDVVSKLDKYEMKIIYALLEYPQKFWRIANRYYNSRRTRPETGFYNKLEDVISEKKFYSDFLIRFKEYIELS
jgi:spore coat protein I